MPEKISSKIRGALDGLCVGDALAMPVHWYYNRRALHNDYGLVKDYLTPHNPHPDSILWRSSYRALHSKSEILHDQAPYWGQKRIHYHQFLKAGENTLNVKLCRLLIESIHQMGTYDADDFLERYIAFMTTRGSHQDTYIEECHRNFFTNYARGVSPRKCGVTEKHIGGLVGIVPLLTYYAAQPEKAREASLAHMSLTHPGPRMKTAALLLMDTLLEVIAGRALKVVILENLTAQSSPLLGHPFLKWLNQPDEKIIGRRFSTACYVEDALPAVMYLALKYHQDPEQALVVNTNLAGDNAGRGAVLGALLGAEHGVDVFPKRWIQGLAEPLSKLLPVGWVTF